MNQGKLSTILKINVTALLIVFVLGLQARTNKFINDRNVADTISSHVNNQNCLWYKQPAGKWKEALPVGNGRLGAMVYGAARHDTIQLNEGSVWAGSKQDGNNPGAQQYLPLVRKALFEGKIATAEKLAKNLVASPPRIRPYQTLGDFTIDYNWNEIAKNYYRELNLQNGVSTTRYTVGDAKICQQVFVSTLENCVVIRIESSKKASINAKFKLARIKDATSEAFENGVIEMKGQINDEENAKEGKGGAHLKFAAEARINVKDGKIEAKNNALDVTNATIVEIRITGFTDYSFDKLDFDRTIDPLFNCRKILEKSDHKSVSDILEDHIRDHSQIFNRVSLDLGEDSLQKYPTDIRLKKLKAGGIDNGLTALFFQYGRYLLLNSSRKPGVLPANLQGIWNNDLDPLWQSDFHMNINLQMNYWPAEVCNLSETNELLYQFIEKLSGPGSQTAKETYGAKGWVLHLLTNPYGYSAPNDDLWGLTPTCGAWMTFPLYEHYLFTCDKEYLRRLYPLMKGACDFFTDYLILSPDGYLVTSPSTSSENTYFVPDSDTKARLTYMPTTDIVILNGLFNNLCDAANILGIDTDYVKKIKEIQRKLPPVRINRNGAIQEWINDYKESEPGNRHYSQLIGLYPLNQITNKTPELYDAAKKTVKIRTTNCDYRSGWHIAWTINHYARLKEANEANEDIKRLLKSLWGNMFDQNCDVFQIDGNSGGTAGIAEMLVQSQNGYIEILPALPDEWKEGHVKGLCARGGFELEFDWKKGALNNLQVLSKSGNNLSLMYKGKYIKLTTQKGKSYSLKNTFQN